MASAQFSSSSSGIAEIEFQFVGFRIVVRMRLEVADLPLQGLDLVDGPLHRDLEGIHRAFEALEEVHLHHADQDVFAVGLGEGSPSLLFVLRP